LRISRRERAAKDNLKNGTISREAVGWIRMLGGALAAFMRR
jgi:hypothetical protein